MAKKANKFENLEGIMLRVFNIFFIVDTGESMRGAKIASVNSAIRNVIPEIQKISDDNADAEIKIAALQFSTGAQWLAPQKPIDVDDFMWQDLTASGSSDLGVACKELNEKLSRDNFMCYPCGSLASMIILLSDGKFTDIYTKELSALKENNWFRYAHKFAITIGNDANTDVLAEFTSHKERVCAYTPITIIDLIKLVPWHNDELVNCNICNDYHYCDVMCDCERYGLSNQDVLNEQIAYTDENLDDVVKMLFEIKKLCSIEIFHKPSVFMSVFNDLSGNNRQHKRMGRLLRDALAEFDAFTVLVEARESGQKFADKVLVDKICEEKLLDRVHVEQAVGYLCHIAGYKLLGNNFELPDNDTWDW